MGTFTSTRAWVIGPVLAGGVLLTAFGASGVAQDRKPGSPSLSGQYRILDGKEAIDWLIENDYITDKHYPKQNFETFRAGLMSNPKPGPHGLVAIMAQGWTMTGPMKNRIENPVIIIDLPSKKGPGGGGGLVVTKLPDDVSAVHTYRGIPNRTIQFKACKIRFRITNHLKEAVTWKEGWFEGTDIEGRMKLRKMSYVRPELAAGATTVRGDQIDCPEGNGFRGQWRAWGHGVLKDGTVVRWEASGTCGGS
jgi:hypothetical protein